MGRGSIASRAAQLQSPDMRSHYAASLSRSFCLLFVTIQQVNSSERCAHEAFGPCLMSRVITVITLEIVLQGGMWAPRASIKVRFHAFETASTEPPRHNVLVRRQKAL